MKNTVVLDVKDYAKKHYKLILLSIAASILCFGALSFSGSIRIDTEELLNEPGTTLGWLTIGRYGLVFLKRLLGLGTHSVWKSGLLFFLFFIAGANLLTFSFYRLTDKKERYPYWIFMLLYCTSNIWSFQVYFSLQQAEVALAMLLLVMAALLSVKVCFDANGKTDILRFLLSMVFLVIGLGAYQALAAYYIAVCISLFLVAAVNAKRHCKEKRETGTQTASVDNVREKMESHACNSDDLKLFRGIVLLVIHFGISYLLYTHIANTWFMAAGDYMESQMGWGRLAALDCIKNILRTAKNILLGYGPRNFSFFTVGALLAVMLIICAWKQKWFRTKMRYALFVLALAGLLLSPFLMTIYMGEMLVTRSQFALPVAAAFLGMYGTGMLTEKQKPHWKRKLCMGLAVAVAAVQTGYNLRLVHTDQVRYRQDVQLTEEMSAALRAAAGGEVPKQPVVFVGYREAELEGIDRRTEMYGWSFYEWDYSETNPTGASHRIIGFMQAEQGIVLQETTKKEELQEAVSFAENMPVFPEEGSVCTTGDIVVVKLSEIEERSGLDWW